MSVPRRIPVLLHGPGCNLVEWYGVPHSCAVLGGCAIDAQVSLLWQHSAEPEMSASALYSRCLVTIIIWLFELCAIQNEPDSGVSLSVDLSQHGTVCRQPCSVTTVCHSTLSDRNWTTLISWDNYEHRPTPLRHLRDVDAVITRVKTYLIAYLLAIRLIQKIRIWTQDGRSKALSALGVIKPSDVVYYVSILHYIFMIWKQEIRMCFRTKNRKSSLELAPPTLAQKNSKNTENNPPLLLLLSAFIKR